MFATIFTFAFVMAYAAVEIPSYIHVCGRRDPNLSKCIASSVDDLKDRICKGIPELNTPPLVPFSVNQITISETNNAKLYLKDSKITGLCDFVINSFHIDLDKLYFNTEIIFKQVYLNGTYDFDIKVLVPFVHQGPVYVTADDVGAKIKVDLKLITKNDKQYIYVSKINLNLDIKTLESKFDLNAKELTQLNEIISSLLGSNQEEFISKIKPSLETEISKHLILLTNNILKQFTFDELFPDRT